VFYIGKPQALSKELQGRNVEGSLKGRAGAVPLRILAGNAFEPLSPEAGDGGRAKIEEALRTAGPDS
jgi:hypothetical protein